MGRQDIVVQQIIAKYPATPLVANSADFTFAASDNVNGDQFPLTGREVIIVHNTDAANPHFVMITSVLDKQNRLGTIGDAAATYSLGLSEYAVFGPLPCAGWEQADGMLYLDSDAVTIEYAVLRLPN